MSKKDNSSNKGSDSNDYLKKGLSSAGDLASLDKPTDKPTETQKPSDSSNNNESSSGQSENENTNGKN